MAWPAGSSAPASHAVAAKLLLDTKTSLHFYSASRLCDALLPRCSSERTRQVRGRISKCECEQIHNVHPNVQLHRRHQWHAQTTSRVTQASMAAAKSTCVIMRMAFCHCDPRSMCMRHTLSGASSRNSFRRVPRSLRIPCRKLTAFDLGKGA